MFEEPAYRWSDPAWRESAAAWMDAALSRLGHKVTGPVSGVRFTPWSAVLCAATDVGDVYFKACGPSQRHEPALTLFLAKSFPGRIVEVLAADLERGWLLTADGGSTLTGAIRGPDDGYVHWKAVLLLIAEMQQNLLSQGKELLAAGLDRRPQALPDLLGRLLDRPEQFLMGEPGALLPDELDRLRRAVPQLDRCCFELSTGGLPGTLVIDDLHEDHIFARSVDGSWQYAFFDFGDACVSHPFVQLVSEPRFVATRFESQTGVLLNSLHEEYVRAWLGFAPLPALERQAAVARAAGCIIRALTWTNACAGHLDELTGPLRVAYRTRLAFWLNQFVMRADELESR